MWGFTYKSPSELKKKKIAETNLLFVLGTLLITMTDDVPAKSSIRRQGFILAHT